VIQEITNKIGFKT